MDFAQAISLHRAGELEAAALAYRDLIGRHANVAAMCNLAAILRADGRLEEAEQLLRSALDLQPDRVPARLNLGNLLYHSNRLPEAAAAYSEVLRLDPAHTQALYDLGNVYLALGRDAEGWALYDNRAPRLGSKGRALSFPEWRGEPLAGKRLLVLAEQGLGDKIFAARYLAQTGAAHVTLACPPELCRLFSTLPVQILPWREGVSVEPHDVWSSAMSLPRWCEPSAAPYLFGTARVSGGIGVAWRGNRLPDPNRSLPPDLAADLLSLPGAVSLLPEDTGAGDFQDTADLIAGLDLTISVDTSIAHLAGAMGRPVIVLLQHANPDWRWRDCPPWYPTADVRRQPKRGDWASLVAEVKQLVLKRGQAEP